MQITTTTHPAGQVTADVLVVPFFHKEETLGEPLATLDSLLGGAISDARRWKEASGKPAETLLLHTQGKLPAQRVLIVGCGKTSEFTAERTRWYGSAAVRYLGQREARQVAIVLPGKLEPKAELAAIARGLVMGEYEPDQYKTEDKRESKVEGVTIVLPGPVEGTEEIVRRSTIVAEAANHARFLINEPGNKVTPTTLAQEARSLAEKYGLGVEVLDAEECRKLGMEAFLGVAQGSDVPPKLIFLRYTAPKESAITLGLVGKGITFDSGGISLKPAKDMHLMKHDMSGAAAVIATFEVIGQLRPAINVIGVVAATENMPGGRALKPGDILRAMNGKTIEVLNTDAEGRLILADALPYAIEKGATHLVDLATLTGAVVSALGHSIAGVMGRPDSWVEQVRSAANAAGENVWPLPLYADYARILHSDVADVVNSPGQPPGTIIGGLFLKEFVKDSIPWVHMDIAGTVWNDKGKLYLPPGPTGWGVATLVELIRSMEG